jgi:hypothetical protein
MVRGWGVVYIYTVGGSDSEEAGPIGREVAVIGGWMNNWLWRGEVYKYVCVWIIVLYLAAVSYSSVYVAVASRTC